MRSLHHAAFAAALLACTALAPLAAHAQTEFRANLEGSQQTPEVNAPSSGSAILRLNAAEDRLEIEIEIAGIDLDGNQTADIVDNLFSAHIHANVPGLNGPIAFGFQLPNSDENGDLVIDPIAGTIVSAWDLDEGDGTTLSEQLPVLFAGGLYLNVHTPRNIAGELRGQILQPALDADLDGADDAADNCPTIQNGPVSGPHDQLDADGDGVGNVCDGDFNQDQFVGGPDFDTFLQCFNKAVDESVGPTEDPNCEESDMNGDGFVGGPDFDLFLGVFNRVVGLGCGLGFELAAVLAVCGWLRRRR